MSDEQREKAAEEMIRLLGQVVTDIKRRHKPAKKLHQNVRGSISCPRCDGVIDYSIDGYRWHSRGSCRSCDLNWRE